MLAVTLVLYALSTWDWAIDIQLLRDDLKVFLPADLIQPPPDHTRRLKVNTALHISQSITNNISVHHSTPLLESFLLMKSLDHAERRGGLLESLRSLRSR
jgi:hypothetical protein